MLLHYLFGLIAIPFSVEAACGLSIGNKVIYEVVMQKFDLYKKQYKKVRQTFKSFDNFYKKSLEDNLSDICEKESLCNFSLSTLMKQKMKVFS